MQRNINKRIICYIKNIKTLWEDIDVVLIFSTVKDRIEKTINTFVCIGVYKRGKGSI